MLSINLIEPIKISYEHAETTRVGGLYVEGFTDASGNAFLLVYFRPDSKPIEISAGNVKSITCL